MARVIVLGVGNALMRDEGVGARAAERLRDRVPPGIEVVVTGALGAATLPEVEGATHLLVLDAVDAGLAPGTVVRLEPDALLTRGVSRSAHEFGVPDLLLLLEHEGRAPERVVVVGVQPAAVEPGTDLSLEVEGALPRVVAAALDVLDEWV